MREGLTRYHVGKPGSERTFGFVLAVCLGLVALSPLWHGLPVRSWPLFAALVLAVLGAVRPAVLKPLNAIWTELGLALNRVTSPLLLAVVFYGAVVPTGLLMRTLGRAPMPLKRNSAASTYWIKRSASAPSSMRRQF